MIVAKSKVLERERVRRGLNKKELAVGAGVDRSSVVRAEQGLPVSPRTSKKLCDFLGMPLEELFSLNDKEAN